ncbi:MAG TPA: efflux RND transporter periplasmic adaptor subunit [Syntrophomonadaceae bacterium]|nr:efflux RND transporter periplasmic adaptor subunit [Syntrophomonadaceae bacterium]
MKKNKVWWAASVGVFIVAVIAYNYAAGAQQVDTAVVKKGVLSKTIMETGYVQTVDQYDVQVQQGGQVLELPVKAGETVKQGQILMVLGNPDLQTAASQAQAQLSTVQGQLAQAQQTLTSNQVELQDAQTAYDRQRELQSAGASAPADLEAANSRLLKAGDAVQRQEEYIESLVKSVEVNRQLVDENQSKTTSLTVVSPGDGTLLDLPVKAGAVVTAGSTVAQIGTPHRLEVQADLLSDQLADVRLGQNVYISAAVLGDKVLTGKLREIRPRAYAKTSALGVEQRRVPVFTDLPDPSILKPGYEVQVRVETARKDGALLLPREAVKTTSQGHYQVIKIQQGRVKYQDVTLGLNNQDQVEILTGLQEGDQVVRDASQQLTENTRVKG